MNSVATPRGRSPFYRIVSSIVLVTFTTYMAGCSFFVSGQQNISVTSDPDNAKVIINGNFAGTTPLMYSIDRKNESMISVSKDGYRSINRPTSRKLSTTGILDVIGGCIFLLPFLGLISSGAWEQEPAHIGVSLMPNEE
ncbi:PEGA domain-containing protein [bacterium]|nr:PEGA domain-containing protein [bacterium]